MKRNPSSHKGQNGTVAVIGGSPLFHGAPIFSSLAAEASGVDLVFPVVHASHADVTKNASSGFIVRTFERDSLSTSDCDALLPLLREVHCAVVGPGMAETKENEKALRMLVSTSPCAFVLDARALKANIVRAIRKDATVVLTPHMGELETLTGRTLTDASRATIVRIATELAKESGCVVLLKGPEDLIVSRTGRRVIVKGGDAGLTKGGTGDSLAGLVAGLIAQNMKPFDAAVLASRTIKHAGALLRKTLGYGYTTRQVIDAVAPTLHRLSA